MIQRLGNYSGFGKHQKERKMDPEKFAKIQVQMKQNQQEYGDFLQDLDSWGQEMKEKDTALKSQGSNKVLDDSVVSTKSRSLFY